MYTSTVDCPIGVCIGRDWVLKVCAGVDWTPGSAICGTCGTSPIKAKWFCRAKRGDRNSCRLIYLRNHLWTYARTAAKKRDIFRCVKCGSREELEVNHITPLGDGSYGKMSCRHHQDNLETVCHTCHVTITRQQRSKR